jgi:hypothetical protein
MVCFYPEKQLSVVQASPPSVKRFLILPILPPRIGHFLLFSLHFFFSLAVLDFELGLMLAKLGALPLEPLNQPSSLHF